jgi:hypothetical protein
VGYVSAVGAKETNHASVVTVSSQVVQLVANECCAPIGLDGWGSILSLMSHIHTSEGKKAVSFGGCQVYVAVTA